MTEALEEVARTLRMMSLVSLTRPQLGPKDAPTLELIRFDLHAYAYSSIAYVRDVLDGFLVLVTAKNVAALDFVIRGLYEWTMQASYVDQEMRGPLKTGNYVACRLVMDRIQSGNGWVRKHGDKYEKAPLDDEIPDSLRIKHLVKAYKAHQLESRNEEDVENDYGYLSEHAHPNSFCFLDVTQRHGQVIEFVRPRFERRNRGIVTASVLDWCLCIYNILSLADERPIKMEFVGMLQRVVKKHEGRPQG